MKTFREMIEGTTVYFEKDTLWVAHGQGSGTTTYMPDTKKYMTDKTGDKNFDSNVRKIVQWANKAKTMKKKKGAKLLAIPYYDHTRTGTFDVHGGDIKPKKNYYMNISESAITVINIFENKNEAVNWFNSIA